jgi:hypothetical protein
MAAVVKSKLDYIYIYSSTDTDEPIQNLTLSNNKVRENSEIGTRVGTFDAYDPDIHRPKTMKFSLVGPKYPPFTLQGVNNEKLVVNGSLNFEENSDYFLTIIVTDTIGRSLPQPFIITIIGEKIQPLSELVLHWRKISTDRKVSENIIVKS